MNIDKILRKKQTAKREGNLQQLAEITKILGDMYFENRQPRKALQEYMEQLSICENLQDKLNGAIAHRMIGEVYANLGDYEQALVHQNLHLEGAKDMNNLIEEQRALATLGRTYFCLAESLLNQSQKHSEALASAKTAYVNSMELCDKLGAEIKLEEKTLMRARLLLNLGLTLEAQNETQQAIDLIEQAAALCISNNFQEDLHRTCISLAAIYERQGNCELSLNYIDTAATVNDICLKAEAKISKAEFFMRIGEWIEARKILVSLYKTSGLSKDINHQVERYLRIIITLCRAENNLIEIETDIQAKQKLYETLGDAAVAVQCFNKGAEYYQHMLNCAEKTGDHVGSALTSLSQTLKDAGRCQEALPFARKELELCINPQEKCRSALFLTDLLIATNAADTEIREHYALALHLANESDNTKLQKSVAKEFIDYLENVSRFEEAQDIKQKAGLASETLSDTESEESSSEKIDMIGADICLEDLSDLEIEENVKRTNVTKRKGKRAPPIKRNEKGETQLHVACIKGDIGAVEKLLSANHATNVRDHCGWTPLHEAANYGYTEIAELLLKHDANVNDPGGISCKGTTPLHDAACGGHFSTMYLLMQHGANITLKTHDGDTVLDWLEDWRDRTDNLSPEDLVEYETMHKKLSTVISTKKKRKKFDIQSPDKKCEIQKISAGEDYKRTIANLRSFNKTINNSSVASKNGNNVTPLVNEEQVLIDDWLEDDIGSTAKKKSTSSSYITTSKRKSIDGNVEGATKRLKRNDTSTIFQNKEDFNTSEDSNDSIVTEVIQLEETFEKSRKSERKRQVSLLSSAFTVSRTPSPIQLQSSPYASISSKQCNKEHVTLHIFVKEKDKSERKAFDFKIDICEDEKEFLTCITTTLEHMFFKETGCTVKLMLQPISGKQNITKEDILRITKEDICANDKLECQIVELQIPSIIERYKTICSTHNIIPCEIMLKCLKCCENTSVFRIKPDDISNEMLVPLLKTLEYQRNIKLLQLSGTVLLTAGIYLHQCLSNLSSLQELYLKGCDIDFACLGEINSLPPQLRVLDLSYNPLSSESCETLRKLITPLRYLQTLNLRYCQLEDFCPPFDNPNLTNCDISWNKLSRDVLISFLSRHLFDLNLSNTLPLLSNYESHNRFTLNLDTMSTSLLPNLESLELAFCDVTDSDVKIILTRLPRLLKLILSGNTNVSVLSINMLLNHHPTLTYIDVSGCENITCDPDVGTFIQNPEICTLLASIDFNLCDSWIKLWRGIGVVTKLPHNLAIFKPI